MEFILTSSEEKHNQTIVRITTSCWFDSNGAYYKRSLKFLKRKSYGYNHVLEECHMTGATDALENIVNLHSVEDGVYEVVIVNESRDWETGIVDDWELELIPFRDMIGFEDMCDMYNVKAKENNDRVEAYKNEY